MKKLQRLITKFFAKKPNYKLAKKTWFDQNIYSFRIKETPPGYSYHNTNIEFKCDKGSTIRYRGGSYSQFMDFMWKLSDHKKFYYALIEDRKDDARLSFWYELKEDYDHGIKMTKQEERREKKLRELLT